MNDDLRHFRQVVEEYREHPEVPRFAGALSIAAIVMLLITNFTLAHRAPINAAELNAEPGAPTSSMAGASRAHMPPASAPHTPDASHWTQVLAACMAGRGFDWLDPLTGAWKLVECDVQELKIVELGKR